MNCPNCGSDSMYREEHHVYRREAAYGIVGDDDAEFERLERCSVWRCVSCNRVVRDTDKDQNDE